MNRLLLGGFAALLTLAGCVGGGSDPSGGAASERADASGDPNRSLRDAARIANSRGDFAGAERAVRRLLDWQQQNLAPRSPQIGETLLMLAAEVANQERNEEADGLMRRAEESLAEGVDAPMRARLNLDQAYMAAGRRDTTRARSLAREAAQGFNKAAQEGGGVVPGSALRRGPLRAAAAQALLLESAMALAARDAGDAERAIRDGLAILDGTPGIPLWWRPAFLMQASDVAAKRDRMDDAEQYLLTALALRERLVGNSASTAAVHMALGRHYRERGMLLESLAAFRRGISILEAADRGAEELTVNRLYPYLDVLYRAAEKYPAERAGLHAEMYRAAQTIQAGVAADTIEFASLRLSIDDPALAKLVQDLADARRRRDAVQLEMAPETIKPASLRNPVREADLARQFREAEAEVIALETRQRTEFPAMSRLGAKRPVRETDVQARLAPDEAAVSFVIGREGGYAFLARADRIHVAEVDMDEGEAQQQVTRLRDAFTARDGRLPAFDLARSFALYRLLFGGLAGDLTGINHLVVVTNGPLSALPPALLVSEAPRGNDYRQAAWLARSTALSTAPSIRAFLDMRAARTRPVAPQPFLGFGDPRFEGARSDQGLNALGDACRDGAMDPALIRALAPLPDTAPELRRIAQVFGQDASTVRLGDAATEAAVRAATLDRYRILYFATHGLLPGELKCQSRPGLALTPPGRGQTVVTNDDGMLDADEIATLKLNADLVVLSACNTAGGRGGKFGGEALSGLAEAFFYAGARSLLVSHWQVPSAETAELTVAMFGSLGPDLATGTAEALRQAQLRRIAEGRDAHPFFWAAFTLVGDGGKAPAEIDRQRARVQQAAR